ncbi:oligosaccharide flippase family protein [Neptunitalea lumnitzerae]|uniref:Sugar isomerase n=1 Tax=Neptunitalea lumnitzerae TaxID=2965509 RepID=A0ABQ5MF96_9FLAO|nr:oligosaccharide flippase family protein [Neptunitalea sp. Y10]GLB48059.1 sugar isomerase [Neptunitalea sp. Y10]
MQAISKILPKRISGEQLFMLSVLVVNGGNYLYNLLMGRILGPEKFADAAILITFLLVLSFIAMTFQLVTAKFSVLFENGTLKRFIGRTYVHGALFGVFMGAAIFIFAPQLQQVFNTSTAIMFKVFGIGVPLYFLMSVNRGVFQGKKEFKSLSITYQGEMLSRLVITFTLLFLSGLESSVVISLGILISFGVGLVPFKYKNISLSKHIAISKAENKQVRNFFLLTAFYELTQIIINNSDILLVKHYFASYEAGLYASLALIGRIVYFVAWMFVMLLLPTVVALKKEGKPTAHVLFKYVGYIGAIALVIVLGCVLFPKTVITILFGSEYLSMAPLLWKYAVATAMFAISNIFAYYYLSLDKYVPVIISAIFGMLQVGLVAVFHKNLAQVVHMQIVAMAMLLIIQMIFFVISNRKEKRTIID